MNRKRQIRRKQIIPGCIFGGLFVCLFFVFAGCGNKKPEQDSVPALSKAMEAAVQYECELCETESVQGLIDGAYTDAADNGITQTFLWSFLELEPDRAYTQYGTVLAEKVRENETIGTASLQKAGLTFLRIGNCDELQNELIRKGIEHTGEESVMGSIYGIMLMNEADSSFYTEAFYNEKVDKLLALQKADGGFCYQGENGDVDVTAFAIQALAPLYEENTDVHRVIDECLGFLEEQQRADAGFESMGNPNLESSAQVLLALTALGKDALCEERFMKDGRTVFDELLEYQLPNGAFSHKKGGKENAMATSQALQALVFYQKQFGTEKNLGTDSVLRGDYRVLLSVVIVVIAIFYGILMARNSRKKILSEIFVVTAILILVWAFRIQLPEGESQLKETENYSDQMIEVSVLIRCDSVLSKKPANTATDFSKVIPQDGCMLAETVVSTAEDSTAFDVLRTVCEENKIQLQYRGDTIYGSYYVEGIGYLYELDFGDLSGWMYRVNGEFPGVGAGEYQLKSGDLLEWLYTTDIGHDL